MNVDTVLYCKRGKHDYAPVLSVSVNDSDADAKVNARKQELITLCTAQGAVAPLFKTVKGSGGVK